MRIGFSLLVAVQAFSAPNPVAVDRPRRSGDFHWGYEHEHGADWSDAKEECGKERQSPIDIPAETAEKPSVNFNLENFDKAIDWSGLNTGHGVKLTPNSEEKIKTTGGDLPGPYVLAQFHFHWGSATHGGSEHKVAGGQHFAEIHLVHTKEEYGDDYMSHDDGLGVLGFFVDVEEGAEEGPLDELIQNQIATKVLDPQATTAITGIAMGDLLPKTFDDYYRYLGSLTTPGCNEVVVWTVFKNSIKISPKTRDVMVSMAEFDDTDVPLTENYRAVQALNGRTVTFYSTSVTEEKAMPETGEQGAISNDPNDPLNEVRVGDTDDNSTTSTVAPSTTSPVATTTSASPLISYSFALIVSMILLTNL